MLIPMILFPVYPLQPIEIVKAKGSSVWDKNGQEYIDLYGGHAVISIGHGHPHYIQRITAQLNDIGFYSNSIIIGLQNQLADKLGKISQKDDYQLFLCNSGAEANENAMKLASFHTGRKKILSFSKAFHGRTSLAVAATDNPAIVAPVNETPNVHFLPFNDVVALENFFAAEGHDLAAVIIEGIQGVGGIREASPQFLVTLRQLCTKHGVVLIADSVQCGYGRTGQFFAHDVAGINADIYSMAKGMGNGFPIGGIAIAPHIQGSFGLLGTTFGGNHLACTAALAVLEVMEQEELMNNAQKIGNYWLEELKKFDGILEVRGRGLMIGIELPSDRKEIKQNLLIKHKIFTGEAKPNVIRLLPALNITQSAADRFLEALHTELHH
jgi:acetylornithine/N-succinyldiaminopimelate aminotransferase